MGDKTMHTLKEFKGSMIGETPFTHLDERPWQYLYTFGKYSRVPIRFVDWSWIFNPCCSQQRPKHSRSGWEGYWIEQKTCRPHLHGLING